MSPGRNLPSRIRYVAGQRTGAAQHHGGLGSKPPPVTPRRDREMKFSKRLVAGLSGTVLAASALMIVGASPASATAPTGGCWVYSPTTPGRPIEATRPVSAAPRRRWRRGPTRPRLRAADYMLTSQRRHRVGGTRNFSMTFNKGPKNGGPPPAARRTTTSRSTAWTCLRSRSPFTVGPRALRSRVARSPGRSRSPRAGANDITLPQGDLRHPDLLHPCGRATGRPAATEPGGQPGDDTGRTPTSPTTFTATGPTATITGGQQPGRHHARPHGTTSSRSR